MVPLNITLDSSKSVTVLSNVFIDQYMRDANDAQIKVYLYLLRMVSGGLATDISEIADKFNHTEKDVIRSLKYWDELKLISLSYDDSNNIVGIALRDLNSSEGSSVSKKTVADSEGVKEIPMISMDYAKEREKYSLEDIKRLSSNPEVKMVLNASALYFGRPLNPNEIRTILFIYDRLGFSLDLTDYLVDYCVDHGQKNIHFIENVAINWYEEGIDTVAKAKQATKKTDKSAYSIMKFLGKTSEPTAAEIEYIRKWTGTYSFNLPIIEEACQRTVLATEKNRFQYADSIMKSWFNSGVKTKKDIAKLDEEYASGKVQKSITPVKHTPSSSNGFLKIEQQDYDFDAVEKALTK